MDNSAHPAVSVDIDLVLVLPADTQAPVPVMIMFRGGTLPQAMGLAPFTGPGGVPVTAPPGADPPATEQLVASGCGHAGGTDGGEGGFATGGIPAAA